MDEATAELVLQLQLEDIEQLTRTSKGKRREGDIDDFQLALSLYTAEIQSNATCITDHQMSLSMRNAVRQDAKLIAKWTAQEAQATHDHGLALEIQNGGGATASRAAGRDGGDRPIPNKRNDDTEKELLDKLAALYMFGPADGYDDSHDDDDDNIAQPESSSWAASRPRTKQSQQKPNNKQCVACMENFPSHAVAHAPCSHNYCRTCLTELFTRSLTDQSLFPPRCCGQAIPVGQNRHVLTRQLVGQFEAKKVELETKNPTYCHRPNCSTFIPPQFIRDDIGTCPRCTTRTCAICKGAPHTGDCPDDPATQQLMQVAAENGWQRCNSCHRLVELRSGCYHMTCLCRAEFCYVCAAPWKTCQCPQWQEDRLIERAEAVVERDVGNLVMPVQERHNLILQARQQLIDDHECDHDSWRRIGGPRACEECGHVMPLWLNVCRQCSIMVCRRCRYNRL